jgi:stearoyl-CoA desaturase (Delta-9 desaturase)
MSVTIYYHRGQAHGALKFNPVLEHFMRFWLWATTGMIQAEWVAVHRRHHQRSDQPGDPHSPGVFGIWTVLFQGVRLYQAAAKDRTLVQSLSTGTPTDWIERNIYSAHSKLGVTLLLMVNLGLFGAWGLLIWAIQILWIPFWAAGVVNGIGHWWGYRNGNTKDNSRNIVPWGIVIGGEELHNSHHCDPVSAKFSQHWWEFDIGWMYICVFRKLGLVRLRTT